MPQGYYEVTTNRRTKIVRAESGFSAWYCGMAGGPFNEKLVKTRDVTATVTAREIGPPQLLERHVLENGKWLEVYKRPDGCYALFHDNGEEWSGYPTERFKDVLVAEFLACQDYLSTRPD